MSLKNVHDSLSILQRILKTKKLLNDDIQIENYFPMFMINEFHVFIDEYFSSSKVVFFKVSDPQRITMLKQNIKHMVF